MTEAKKISLTFKGLSPQQVSDIASGTTADVEAGRAAGWSERLKDQVEALAQTLGEKQDLKEWADTPEGRETVTKIQALLRTAQPPRKKDGFTL